MTESDEIKEDVFYFKNEDSHLLAILRSPTGRCRNQGIVFCDAFAEEKTISHRVLVDFARELCRSGFHVLSFDYRGCGDSEGDFEQATLATRLSDVQQAITVLCERTGLQSVTLFGLRLGGTWASLVSRDDHRVDALVMWEPIVQVGRYLDQFLRQRVTAMNLIAGRTVDTRPALQQQLKSGTAVDILGFLLSPECFHELEPVDLLKGTFSFRGPTLLCGINKRGRARADLSALRDHLQHQAVPVKFVSVQELPFWIDANNPFRELTSWQDHEELFRQTATWLASNTPKYEYNE